jgi:hypothetical protein
MRWIFSVDLNPSRRNMVLGSTQPLTEMSTTHLPGGVKGGRRVGLTNLPPSVSRMSGNMGASTSHNHMGLHGLYRSLPNGFISKTALQYTNLADL